jgi:hypothetical protein
VSAATGEGVREILLALVTLRGRLQKKNE